VGHSPIYDVCQTCELCTSGYETSCPVSLLLHCFRGSVYILLTLHAQNRTVTMYTVNGSYAEYVTRPARYTPRIPKDVDHTLAGPILCAGSTVYQSLVAASRKPGEWVVIPGAGGGLGHIAVQMARAFGLRVIAIDTGDVKRDLCLSLGAEHFIDFRKSSDTVETVIKITSGGAHAVLVTGGSPGAYASAPAFLRVRGTIVTIGLPPKGTTVAGAEPHILCAKRLTVIPGYVGSLNDISRAFEFVSRGLVIPKVSVHPFEQFEQVIRDLIESRIVGRAVVRFRD
jgi:propanol-preferring alcohol dehydrogenase